jgi:hypothetical protein
LNKINPIALPLSIVLKKMKNTLKISLLFSTILLFTWACNKSSELGADLFEADRFNFQYVDTLSINAITEQSPAIIGYLSGAASDNILMVGKMEDPVFGIAEKRIYALLVPSDTTFVSNPIVDSVVFRMYYHPTGTYGDTSQTQKIGVYRLTQELKAEGGVINNDKTFPTESRPLGTATFVPTPNVITTVPNTGDTSKKINLRSRVDVKLDKTFGDELFANNNILGNSTLYASWFKGIEVRAETKTNTTTAFTFSVGDSTALYVYYRTSTTDTVSKVRSLIPTNGSIRYTYSNHDYNNSVVKDFLNSSSKGDSTLFVQCNSGVLTKFELPTLKNLGNIIVNKALLQFTIKPEASPKGFEPIDRILLFKPNFETIVDASTQGGYIDVFGGTLGSKDGQQLYRMNLTIYLQRVLNGKESNYMYLIPENQQFKASRSIFYGSKNKQYGAKLLLYYTKLSG